MDLKYRRPFCSSCRLIWGKSSIGRVFTCTQCGERLTLKSFNPWVKSLWGIGIIGGCLATMVIPGFPVYWLGGLLFGLMLLLNGVRQWQEIMNIDGQSRKHPQSGALETGSTVTCSRCGQRNRINSYSAGLRPICGRCQAPLKQSRATLLACHLRRLWPALIAICAISFIIVLVAVKRTTPPRSAAPSISRHAITVPLEPQHLGNRMPARNRRLPNGTVIRSGNLVGSGRLEINNGLSHDAVVKLVVAQTDECLAYFYVSAGAVHILSNIPDGNYRLLFAAGEDWDESRSFFSRPRGVSEFNKQLSFETHQRYEGNYVYDEYRVIEVTLHTVPKGNVMTHRVTAMEFEGY